MSTLGAVDRERGAKGDAEKAIGWRRWCIMRACWPGSVRPSADFLLSTLFESAFDAGDVEAAQTLLDEIEGTDRSTGKLGTTLPDLELSLRHVTDAGQPAALREIVTRLMQLV